MQVFNPYLPPSVCIPDGEPHVFGDRVYIFGSHDKEGGDTFCMLDYEVFSAPVTDLTKWRSEGTIYRADQDPNYSEMDKYMYAPDVVQGNDGRFYLYYSMSGGHFTAPMHVAVCDTPAGKYEFYGIVRNPDGSIFKRNITFDPGLMNDDGVIRLYYGWALAADNQNIGLEMMTLAGKQKRLQVEMAMFEKTAEEIAAEPMGIQGANVVQLADDMLTVIDGPKRIVPGQFDAAGTSFEGHAFFEASSIRKVGDTYYFIYSSEVQHELCYATSKYPDRDFVYGGIIVDNGDISYKGRLEKDRVAATGNNHGSMENINGQWYMFYHRQTHKTSFSRQGCAEKIEMKSDGSIAQVEMTSCGLNKGPLTAGGSYPAVIACVLTNGHMPHISPQTGNETIPYMTHEGHQQFIADISDGTEIGFKYFAFETAEAKKTVTLKVTVRGSFDGSFEVIAGGYEDGGNAGSGKKIGEIVVKSSAMWYEPSCVLDMTKLAAAASDPSVDGACVAGLFFKYCGHGCGDLLSFEFA